MRKLLRYLFFSETKAYRYNVPKEIVVKRIDDIFSKSGKLLTDPDFEGSFTSGDTFQMSVNSGAVTSGNVKFGSALYGEVRSVEEGDSEIQTNIKVRFPLKLIAITSCLLGFAYLYKAYAEFSLQYALLALTMIFLTPIICNWFGGVFNTAIRDRFERYIDKELGKTSNSNIKL